MSEKLPESPPLVKSLDEFDLSEDTGKSLKQKTKSMNKIVKFLLFFVAFLLLVTGAGAAAGYVYVFKPAEKLVATLQEARTISDESVVLLRNQDIGGLKVQISKVHELLNNVESQLNGFSWASNLPYAKDYLADGHRGIAASREVLAAGNLSIEAVAPYADIIGLKGVAPVGDGSKTAEDRINFILNTLEKVSPQLQEIGKHLEVAKSKMNEIDPARYPEEYQGVAVRQQLQNARLLLDQAATLTNDARPLLESAPYMLGMKSPRKYLVIMQNDAELRPTGGFMTAFAIIQVSKGKISILESDDIYALDAKFTKKITAPQPILKYLPKVPYWNLRDMNLSPDFKVSMDTFYPNYLSTKYPKVDGIITLNTQVLVDILKIIGKIGVPGYGNFSADTDPVCNCPQVFYALELYADVEGPVVWDSISGRIIAAPENYGQRKSFIGPMMYSVLSNVMAQPKAKMGDLFKMGLNLIAEKHVQFYLLDEEAQKAVESFNMAGRVRDYAGDYLQVVDTNFAGAKTNTWVTYSADFDVEVGGDGKVTNTLTLTYKNPQAYFVDKKTNLKLNGIFRNWLRVYLPEGSTLIEAKGFETGQATGSDLGKTVIEGFFTLAPLNNKTITLKYASGYKPDNSNYRLMIQKQAGTKNFPYEISVNKRKLPELILDADKEVSVAY